MREENKKRLEGKELEDVSGGSVPWTYSTLGYCTQCGEKIPDDQLDKYGGLCERCWNDSKKLNSPPTLTIT